MVRYFTLLVALSSLVAGPRAAIAKDPIPPLTDYAWTVDEAWSQLVLDPRDPYLQYVTLQLAKQQNRLDEFTERVDRISGRTARRRRSDRQDRVELFGIFSGALSVHETLQLDTMIDDRAADVPGAAATEGVKLASLQGPETKSHPWKKMLAGSKPQVSELAQMVPADQYFLQCSSLTNLLNLMDFGGLWAGHLFNQATHDATSSNLSQRLRQQLAVRSDPLSRPFYDLVVDQVAVTGSDLFVREGSDVTLIFRLKQPIVFRPRMDSFLEEALRKHADAKETRGNYLGVDYVQVATPDRRVHVFSAYPRKDLHVRSNSIVGLQRVLSAIKNQQYQGQRLVRLGDTNEFKYIRTLMTEGDKKEDVFVYLSDPFIRHMIGPKLRLTERRRILAYNHLRMIGHAALLHQTQFGRPAKALTELVQNQTTFGEFGKGKWAHPLGGTYALSADGLRGKCSLTGEPFLLKPCCEIPLEEVSAAEAAAYRQFLVQYNQYWRTFFDPIAVRVQMTPKQYRVETIVLPLINNSIYDGLAAALGGTPEPLDALPVPERNIFSTVLKLDKEKLFNNAPDRLLDDVSREAQREFGLDPDMKQPDVEAFVRRGIGSQFGMHIYDAEQMFDFNVSGFLGQMMGSFNRGRVGGLDNDFVFVAPLLASLSSPVYVSLPVQDAKVVDTFLEDLDPILTRFARTEQRDGWFELDYDFYHLETTKAGTKVRVFGLQFGPVKWRFFWARIGDGLYIASKKFILDDLEVATARQAEQLASDSKPPSGPQGHAMVRIRAENWNQVLTDYQLGWAENNRLAVLKNLAPLSNVARAYFAAHPSATAVDPLRSMDNVQQLATATYGVQHLLPDGGRYEMSPDGKSVTHSIYGSPRAPRQPPGIHEQGKSSRLLSDFSGATAELIFLEDGLHAVLTIERKGK